MYIHTDSNYATQRFLFEYTIAAERLDEKHFIKVWVSQLLHITNTHILVEMCS